MDYEMRHNLQKSLTGYAGLKLLFDAVIGRLDRAHKDQLPL